MNDELASHDPMPVQRIDTGHGSHVEPPLDQSWDDLTKLRWHAGVVLADSGVEARITTGCYEERGLFGRRKVRWDIYGIEIGSGTTVGYDFRGVWDYLNGVAVGAEAARGDR